jgi:hypothetical protein
MRMLRTAFVVIAATIVSAAPSAALPLTVAFVDTSTGLEWAQLTGTGGVTWDALAGVCATDGATACSGNIGTNEYAGWTWATSGQVLQMFVNATDLTAADMDDQDEWATNSTWAPQFLSLFAANFGDASSRTAAALVSDGPSFDPRGAWTPYVTDAIGAADDDAASKRRVIAKYTTAQGVWLQRAVAPVPEPTTILLIGLGFAGVAARRRRQNAR